MGNPDNIDLQAIVKQLKEENQKLKEKLNYLTSGSSDESNDWFLNVAQKVSKIGMWRYSFPDKKLLCSNEVYNIFEASTSIDLSSVDILRQYISEGDIGRFFQISNEALSNDDNFDIDFQINLKDGNSKFVSVKSRIERDSNGNKLQVIGTITDISDYHFRLQKLQNDENLFRNLFNNLTDIFFILETVKDKNGNIIDYIYKDVNPVFEMIFDLQKSNIINKRFSGQVQLFQQFHPVFKITAITREPYQDRFFVQSLDSFLDVLVYSPSENLVATIWRDVSLMVEATTSLQESEEKYRQIFSIGNDGLFLIDFNTSKIIDVNPAGCSIFGYSKDVMLSLQFKNLFVSPESFEEKIIERKLTHIIETNRNCNGTEFPTEASLSYFNWSGRKVAIVSVRDISDRLKAQEDIVRSEKKFKQLFDYSNDAILIVKNYKIVDFNQKTQQIFNLPADLIKNKTLWNLSPIRQTDGEDSRLKIMEYVQNTLLGNQIQFDWIMQRSDKSLFSADIKMSPILFDTEKVVQVILRDVSPQRKIEEERKVKEERWKYALDINTVGLWDWNIVSNDVYYSSSWKKMLGYEKDEIENKFDEFEKRIHPDDILMVYNNIDAYIAGKQYSFNIEFRIRCKNGTYKWLNSKGKIYSYTNEGKPEHFIGINTDVTRQKQIEIEQDEKLNSLYTAIGLSNIGNWKLDLRTMIISGPESTFSMFGFDNTNQTSLKQLEELVYHEDKKLFISQFGGRTTIEKQSIVFRAIINGVTKYIAANTIPVFNHKVLIRYEGVFQDISFFKEHEIQIKDEQYLLKTISDNSPQGALLLIDNEIIFSKTKLIELFGYSEEDINKLDDGFLSLFVPEDKLKVLKAIENAVKTNKPIGSVEARIETKHHKIKWLGLTVCQIDFKGNKPLLFIFDNITEKKGIEIKLAESENQFKQLSNILPTGIAIIDAQATVLYANKELQSILQKPKSKALILSDLLREKDFNIFKKGLENVVANYASTYQDEFLLVNGLWYNIEVLPLNKDVSNNGLYVLSFINIDVPKRNIELLENENLSSKNLLENSYLGMGVFGHDKKLMHYNPYLLQIFGFENIDTIPKFEDFNLNVDGNIVEFDKLLSDFKKTEFRYQTDNRWLKVVLQPLGNNTHKSLSIFALDITDERYVYYKALESLEKYSLVFNESPVGIAIIDKNRNIELSNKRFKEIWDIADKTGNVQFDKLVSLESLQNCITKFAELFSGVSDEMIEVVDKPTNTGSVRYLATKTTACKDKYNEVVFAVQVVEDVTIKKSDESALINEEKLKTLNLLANSFAHEFNNLLMSVYGNAYLLKSNLSDNKELGACASTLFDSINKAGNLSQKLLSFSKTAKSIHVASTIGELISNSVSNVVLGPSVEINVKHENQHERLICDPSQFHRAIENILVNSIEAMPKGGDIEIETKLVYFQDKSKLIKGLSLGRYLLIHIKDNGIGIHQKEIDKIFDPFYSTKGNKFKAGLGLTIAQNTINNLSGIIKVESIVNEGTVLKIYIPLPDQNRAEYQLQPEEQYIVQGSANILLVDDEDVVRIVVSELLKKLGYSVFGFSNPILAIQFYNENIDNIDIVMLDKQMPQMDGVDAYYKLKEIDPLVKVILLTGFNLDIDLEKIFNEGNNFLLQKPVSIEKLSKAISSTL